MFDFSLLCIFKCFLKSPAREKTYSHWLHLFILMTLSVIFSEIFILVRYKLYPLKPSHDFLLVPLLLCVVLCPNGCFKVSQIYHSILVSRVKFTTTYFHFFLSTLLHCIFKCDPDSMNKYYFRRWNILCQRLVCIPFLQLHGYLQLNWLYESDIDEMPNLTFETRSRFCFLQSRASRRERDFVHLISGFETRSRILCT